MNVRFSAVLAFVATSWSMTAGAAVTTYTDEAAYLSALSALSYGQWSETFEGSAWNGIRTTVDVGGHRNYDTAPSLTNQGVTWEAPGWLTSGSPITTQQRYHNLPGEDAATFAANNWALTAVTRRADYDTIGGTSANLLYGVGGWFDSATGYKYDEDTKSYLPKGHIFVSVDGGAFDDFGAGDEITDPNKLINAIAYDKAPRFFGIIDTAGFHNFTFFSDQSVTVEVGGFPGESSEPGGYGPAVYADNFTFGGTVPVNPPTTAPIPEPSTWAAMMAGLAFLGLRARRRAASAA